MLTERSLVLVFGTIILTIILNGVFGIYLGEENYMSKLLQKISFPFNEKKFTDRQINRIVFAGILAYALMTLFLK